MQTDIIPCVGGMVLQEEEGAEVSQLIYDMTTYYNKTDGVSLTTIKLAGHNSRKTQSPLLLRPSYPPAYKRHTDGRQAQHSKG